jgi:vacuolar protein-sorting-associated protein 4
VCACKNSTTFKKMDLINKGKEIIKEAVAKDNEDKLDEALSLYTKGIEYLIAGVKYEKNKKSKEIINLKVQEYLKRAEELKQEIANANAPKKKKVVKKTTPSSSEEKIEITGENLKVKKITK